MNAADEVGVTTLTTPSDREVVITRVVDGPRRRVWDAWTKPEHLKNWLTGFEGWTMPVCEIDLRAGGKWRFVWRKADGAELGVTGGYKEPVPPDRLGDTVRCGTARPDTVNAMSVTERGGKTAITRTILYPAKDARDAARKTGMKEGIDVSYARLADNLRTMA